MKRERSNSDDKSNTQSKKYYALSNTLFATPPISDNESSEEHGITTNINLYIQSIRTKYHTSFVLTEIGNYLLFKKSIISSLKIDPLEFSKNNLREQIQTYIDATRGCEISNSEENRIKITQYKEKLERLNIQLTKIQNLIQNRNEHNEILTAAFPFTLRKLSTTFKEKYKKGFNLSTERDVSNALYDLYKKLSIHPKIQVSDDLDKIIAFFNINNSKIRNNKFYTQAIVKSLKIKITNIIGPEPTEEDINKYKQSHTNNTKLKDLSSEGIKNYVQEYISDNFHEILKTMQEIARHILHYEFLNALTNQNFCFQVLAYRQISRDLQKTALVEGNTDQKNIPPGLNTTIKLTAGGAASLFLGDMGSYKEIGENNTETLRNYKKYFINSSEEFQTIEKEAVFKSLHIIESIRSSSTLLTLPIFLKLAENNFKPSRQSSIEYHYELISKQFPMAANGAVSGAIFLNNAFSDELTYDFPYDYRDSGNAKNAKNLDSLNSNLLFDYILFKSEANTLNLKELQNEGFVINKNEKDNKQEISKNGYKFTYSKVIEEDEEQIYFDTIKSFPLTIFNEITEEWYGVSQIELNGQVLEMNIEIETID